MLWSVFTARVSLVIQKLRHFRSQVPVRLTIISSVHMVLTFLGRGAVIYICTFLYININLAGCVYISKKYNSMCHICPPRHLRTLCILTYVHTYMKNAGIFQFGYSHTLHINFIYLRLEFYDLFSYKNFLMHDLKALKGDITQIYDGECRHSGEFSGDCIAS